MLKQEQDQGQEDQDEDDEDALDRPYLFYVGDEEVRTNLKECLWRVIVNRERTVPIVYKPQAIFK